MNSGQSDTLKPERYNMSEQKYTLSKVRFSPSDNSKPAGCNWLSQQWKSLIDGEAEIDQDQGGGAK